MNKCDTFRSMATFDFSTLYTKIPHKSLLEVMNTICDFCFQGGANDLLSLTSSGASWVSKTVTTNPFTVPPGHCRSLVFLSCSLAFHTHSSPFLRNGNLKRFFSHSSLIPQMFAKNGLLMTCFLSFFCCSTNVLQEQNLFLIFQSFLIHSSNVRQEGIFADVFLLFLDYSTNVLKEWLYFHVFLSFYFHSLSVFEECVF